MRTIKVRFIKHDKEKYTIQRKSWFKWKDISLFIDMGYGGFWEKYSSRTKEELLDNVLEDYYQVDKRFVRVIEHPTIKIY